MDPVPGEINPAQIEVKIESFLNDTNKIFIETQFTWRKPSDPGTRTQPGEYLEQMDDYISQHVETFMMGQEELNASK